MPLHINMVSLWESSLKFGLYNWGRVVMLVHEVCGRSPSCFACGFLVSQRRGPTGQLGEEVGGGWAQDVLEF